MLRLNRERREIREIIKLSRISRVPRFESQIPENLLSRTLIIAAGLLLGASTAQAQREYTVVKPRERAANETVTASKKATQETKGVLVVILDPVISGKVTILDAAGRLLEQAEASAESGRAEFELRRGHNYRVKVESPGYLGVEGRSGILKASGLVRFRLKAEFAKLELPGLPSGAQIFVDDKLRATADQSETVVLNNLEPGEHWLLVRHPEYNDYRVPLGNLEAGNEARFFPLNTVLVKVAKIKVQGPPGAVLMIDGALQGRIEPDGQLQFNYQLDRAAEHAVRVELLGYQTWTRRELLAPGPRELSIKLDPIVTSTGVSDFFENLSLWNAPSSWKTVTDKRNRKLEVRGSQLGTLKEKIYRDFQANFTLWLNDGEGATWALRADREGRNYYLFHLAGPRSQTHTPNRFYTYLVQDGGEPVEVSTPVPVIIELNQSDSYTITISVRGHTIKHNIINNLKGEDSDLGIWTDTSTNKDRLLYGTFGFRTLASEVFVVDDFTIEPTPPE
ncbi:MAG TPA: hypothetical protein VJ302_06970 [Blastocatellia bacterium]|nr:hypothetical protein [Blastocatellia bacterium]